MIEGGRLPGRREAGGRPGQREGQQRGEPQRLGVLRQEGTEGRGEVERFPGERVDLAGSGRLPVDGIGAVHGFEHSGEPGGKVSAVGNRKRDSSITDTTFGSDQTLRQGGRRQMEHGGDVDGVDAEHGLQHERRTDARIDRRVRTDEQEFKTLIADLLDIDVVQPAGERFGVAFAFAFA